MIAGVPLTAWIGLAVLALWLVAVSLLLLRVRKVANEAHDDVVTVDNALIEAEKQVSANATAVISLTKSVVDLRERTSPRMPVVRPAVPVRARARRELATTPDIPTTKPLQAQTGRHRPPTPELPY